MSELFTKRRLLIATKHQKEQVMAPILAAELGVECQALVIDTDVLGTFSGEVPRLDDPLTTLRKKCELAFQQDRTADLVVASEGSFGPHPSMFFLPANEEWVMLTDKKHGLEITARCLSTETNFSAKQVNAWSALCEFAATAQFPSHGLILRRTEDNYDEVIKGIVTPGGLRQAFDALFEPNVGVYVETDMRAMHNPSRMEVIEQTIRELVNKVRSCCPQCAMPGFDKVAVNSGLLCAACGTPTRGVRSHIFRCQHCDYQEERLFPYGKEQEDPRYCDVCNP